MTLKQEIRKLQYELMQNTQIVYNEKCIIESMIPTRDVSLTMEKINKLIKKNK